MVDQKKRILILQMNPVFLKKLVKSCSSLGDVFTAQSPEEALEAVSLNTFDLLLLQWELISADKPLNFETIRQFQPKSAKIALLHISDLSSVISAMKTGFTDIIWFGIERILLKQKLEDSLTFSPMTGVNHTHMTPLVKALTQRNLDQKATLFQARKEFSKLFLQMMMKHSRLRRPELAALLEVSPRTLQRHLTLSGIFKSSLTPKNP